MPTQKEISASIDSRLEAIQSEQAALKQAFVEAVTKSASKEFLLLKDTLGREVMIYPDLVIGLYHSRIKGPVTNSYFETTIVKQAFIDDAGKSVQTNEFYGMPTQVAELLGLRWHRLDQVPPVAKIIATSVAEANAAIAALGAALTHEVDVTGLTSPVERAAPAGNMVLVVKGWRSINDRREHWTVVSEQGRFRVTEHHGSGFTVVGTGFVGIQLDGDADYVRVAQVA